MKNIRLSNGKEAIVDDDIFELYGKYKWYESRGYAVFGSAKDGIKSFAKMHRLILNAPKGFLVDHRNRNKLDNRRLNLRLATPRGNTQNQNKLPGTRNSYKGTQYIKKINGWQSRCRMNGGDHFLGYYKTEISAAFAYNKKASELSDFACLNDLSQYSKEHLEGILITERLAKTPSEQRSVYSHIFYKKQHGGMKCGKWFIKIPSRKIHRGYFFTEGEAVQHYIDNFSQIEPLSVKKQYKIAA